MHGKAVRFALILMPHCGPGRVPLLLHTLSAATEFALLRHVSLLVFERAT
jgi:hypothetical protein